MNDDDLTAAPEAEPELKSNAAQIVLLLCGGALILLGAATIGYAAYLLVFSEPNDLRGYPLSENTNPFT
ncbi:MAG: hypothetical protein AAFN94_14260, partial [Pseudomonadota bacterium]